MKFPFIDTPEERSLPPNPAQPARRWRWLLPVLLVLLFLAVLLWLPWQAREMEANERQEQLIADTLWVEQTLRFELARDEEALASLGADLVNTQPEASAIQARLAQIFKNGHELSRIMWLDPQGAILATRGVEDADTALTPASVVTGDNARRTRSGRYSDPYRAGGAAMIDYHLPLYRNSVYVGSMVAKFNLKVLLDETVPWWFAHDNAVSILDRDDRPLAQRTDGGSGRGVYTHKHALELPGAMIELATDSVKGAPRLLPNLLVGSVIALALGLLVSLATLWRHIARTLAAEGALRQQMAFRTAMENSLVTGLRARDLEGRVTYVNPAFCEMVGLPPDELLGKVPPMPYWAPEAMAEYEQRFANVLAGNITPQFETMFQHSSGTRVPVLVFEAPLVDSNGKQTGWMGSILDISDRKKAEELNRRQEEKLQQGARLATMGEISSMLAHELNQPLAAISSYTAGALNVLGRALDSGSAVDALLLRRALEQASTQAQRAGQIIKSVHEFVRKREPERKEVAMPRVIDGIRALIDLQARQAFVSVQVHLPPNLPPVHADQILLEQVLLNLTRNAIEAMAQIAPERRVLRIVAESSHGHVAVSVIDHGHGIPPDVAERLFSPFFSTKAEGMGMGLSICRTAIEFHGGTLTHSGNPGGGTVFTFTLPQQADALA